MNSKTLILFLLFSLTILAQQNSDNYLPLEFENYWELRYNDTSTNISDIKITVLDSLLINNNIYFVLDNFIPSPVYQDYDTIRIDEDGNIHKLFLGSDILWFNFPTQESKVDTIKFNPPYSDYSYVCSYSLNNNVITSTGEYTNALKISIQIDFAVSQFKRIYLVKNVGIVATSEFGEGTEGYDYNLYAANVNGSLITDISEENYLPSNYELKQNYPNPFNPSTIINFYLPISGYAELIIYNSIGEIISKPISRYLRAGEHSYYYENNKLSSGIYFCRLITSNINLTKKMTLIR
ncbi:MAG: T9SS type A sorting domain-containing protein [Bacteroidetes bacterium]|nr:T9SS type A sorting domain-containing protein [Bacteroidota bacterium]